MPTAILDIQTRYNIQTANGIMPLEIDVRIPENSIVVVTGESGAGKTTLLRQIAGFVTPTEGHIRFDQTTWFDAKSKIHISPQKRNIGFVFQDYALFPHLTVFQNLKFALDASPSEKVIDELLDAIELTELANRKPHQLSGGQKQRVALARALVRRPKLLLLDEPLAALDPAMRTKLQVYLHQLKEHYEFTALLVTHDLGEIFNLANQVIVLSQGQIIKQGSPQEVYSNLMQTDSLTSIYGKILTIQKHEHFIKIQLLVNNVIKEVIRPLETYSQWIPGKHVLIHFNDDHSNIELL